MIEHVLTHLKKSQPSLKEVFLSSDNAGCYHCGPLMLAIPGISRRVGVTIRRYDFSDPQSGKDICDRRIATMKSHMRRYLNEGNDINSASDMKRALDSYGGVKGCRVAVVNVDTARKETEHQKWTGIQSYNNFEFQRSGIRVWKAYGIGKGKQIHNQEIKRMARPQGKTGLIVHEEFSDPIADKGAFKKPGARKCVPQGVDEAENVDCQAQQQGFPCPEVGCVKVFVLRKNLEKHMDVGKHFYYIHKEGSYDDIKRKWASRCVDVGTVKELTAEATALTGEEKGQPPVVISETGWALKKAKPGVRFSEPVKEFLKGIFLKGEETGQKADPAEVASKLRSVRTQDGGKMFQRSEWLTVQQVKSYFSRLSVLHRSGRFSRNKENKEDDVEEIVMLEEALSRQGLNEDIISNLEL